ncbi:MAG: DUF1987 domain-containing protein [Bacteroidia bacterium]|nr:DUF1987 domain-containing protein [Bacteroidia bacterium]MDW8334945.1 DUF1987 domain-containing protein [Bacteroidia bacterium]
MNPLRIAPTDETPKVDFSPESGQFSIVGNSYPENSTKFYTPVLEWLRNFAAETSGKKITLDFNFEYFNTSSAKYILEILRVIQQCQKNGNECLVRWHYMEEDTDMQEAGEDYRDSIDLPFEFVVHADE